MTREFIPHEEALALRELGFDEDCFGFYFKENEDDVYRLIVNGKTGAFFGYQFKAPLYQQAFRWLKTKYNLRTLYGMWPEGTIGLNLLLDGVKEDDVELESLKTLIEIVKKMNV